MTRWKLAVLCVASVTLGGCASVGAQSSAGTHWYLGAVRVAVPARRGDLSAIDVKALGIGWDAGPLIGWRSGNWVSADPSKCQLLVVVRSAAQAENAARVLNSLGGLSACFADFTHASSR